MKLNTICAAVAMATAMGTSALAHATLEQQDATVGSYYKAVMRIGHGCDGEATLKVRIAIPEGFIAVKPMPKAGWELETVTGAYGNSYDFYGRKLTEGVKEIVWTGNLQDAHYDEFVFRAKIDGSVEADQSVYFATVQECANGENAWVEIPAEGQNPHDLKSPVPGLRLHAPSAHSH